jgi:hypothetical protein
VGPASSKVKSPTVIAVHRRGVTLLLAGPFFAFFASDVKLVPLGRLGEGDLIAETL